MYTLSGWLVPPAIIALGIIGSTFRHVPDPRLRKLLASLWIAFTLALATQVTTDSTGGDYILATISLSTALKLAELFLCEPWASLLPTLPIIPLLVLLLTYQNKSEFESWYLAVYSPASKEETERIKAEGRKQGVELILRGCGFWALLNIITCFLPPSPSEAFLTWPRSGWNFWIFIILNGFGSYLMLAMAHALTGGIYALIFGVKVKEMFNFPFACKSLRDWWSNRWNLCFKDQYYHLVFTAMYGTKVFTGKQKKIYNAVAAMATFIFSGLVHEYIVYVAFGRELSWENMIYFTLNGIGCTLEVLLLPRNFNSTLNRILAIGYLILLGPFFQGPYHRRDAYTTFRIPFFPGTRYIFHHLIAPKSH